MGPCVDAGMCLSTRGALISSDALALSGVGFTTDVVALIVVATPPVADPVSGSVGATALAGGWLGPLGGVAADGLGVAGWIGAVVVVLALGAAISFGVLAAVWAWAAVLTFARVGAAAIDCVGACADSVVSGVGWFGIVSNVGDPPAAPLPPPSPLALPVPLSLPVPILPSGLSIPTSAASPPDTPPAAPNILSIQFNFCSCSIRHVHSGTKCHLQFNTFCCFIRHIPNSTQYTVQDIVCCCFTRYTSGSTKYTIHLNICRCCGS